MNQNKLRGEPQNKKRQPKNKAKEKETNHLIME